jgi:hypothetical protein
MSRILSVEDLRLKSNGAHGNREFALQIEELDIESGDLVFVLGDRGAGKTALRDALDAILCPSIASGRNLTIPQAKVKPQPCVCVRCLERDDCIGFKAISGDCSQFDDAKTVYYADDPCLSGTNDGSGSQIIDQARELSLTLLIGVDPDRLRATLSYFLESDPGRILWLDEGRMFWKGASSEFISEAPALCCDIAKANPNLTQGFVDSIRHSAQGMKK